MKQYKSFFRACKKGNTSHVLKLLAHGLNPTINNSEALLIAIYYHHLNLVKLLIEAGINHSINDSEPLLLAIQNNYYDIVKYLLEIGANAKVQDSLTIIEAVENGNIDILKLLIEYGADPLTNNSEALLIAVSNGSNETSPNDEKYIEIVKFLLSLGADPNAHDTESIICASYASNHIFIKLILDAGADHTVSNSFPLINAVTNSNPDIVRDLLEAGAIPSIYELIEAIDSDNALIENRYQDKIDTILLLLEKDIVIDDNILKLAMNKGQRQEEIFIILKNKFIESEKNSINTNLNIISQLNEKAIKIIRHWSLDGDIIIDDMLNKIINN